MLCEHLFQGIAPSPVQASLTALVPIPQNSLRPRSTTKENRKNNVNVNDNDNRKRFFSESGFFPLMMFPVARQQALMEGLVLRVRSQAQGHDSSTRLEEQTSLEGFLLFSFKAHSAYQPKRGQRNRQPLSYQSLSTSS